MKLLLLTFALRVASSLGLSPNSDFICSSCDADEEESALLQTAKTQVGLASNGPTAAKKSDWTWKVLDVGPPRTGTQTMYGALARLGYNPCHTGVNFEVRPTLCNYKEGDGTFNDVIDLMEENGWDSGMEEPLFLMYKEFMVRFPDSKFVLPMRDSQEWYDSYIHYWKSQDIEKDVALHQEWSKEGAHNCSAARYFGCDFTLSQHYTLAATKDTCIEGYETHVKRVQQIIPADRLLLFNMSDGYPPLCEFLGVEVPTYPNGTVEEFPNDDNFGTKNERR